LEHVYQTEYGAHYLLVYPDLKTLREIYPKYIKTQLQDPNDIMLIYTYYESPNNIRKILYGELDAITRNNSSNCIIS
jgi:hypothetical protein